MKKQAAQARNERRAATARLIEATGQPPTLQREEPPAPMQARDLRRKTDLRHHHARPVATMTAQ